MEHSEHDTSGQQASGGAGSPLSAYEPVADGSTSARDKLSGFKHTIADALESGADKLRRQASNDAATTSTDAGGAFAIASESRLGQTSNQVAGGMQSAADWIREADLDGLKTGIERQVKEHPGRSLAIAVGVGYLLGKAFRRQ